MRIVMDYIATHKKTILFYGMCIGIFSLVFYLSNVPVEAALYGGLLCLVAAILFGIYDFSIFYKHHKALQALSGVIDSQVHRLPDPQRLLDRDYSELIGELYEKKQAEDCQARIQRKELLDYFTLWTHQIKTPIAAMNLLLQSKGAEKESALSMELFQIEEYVNMAMSYIRMGDMSSDLAFEKVELDDLIRETLRKYSQIFIGKGIKVDFVETDHQLVTDRKWLAVVLGQLLSNALKYTPEGKTIFIYRINEMLIIQDTGIGISPEDLPRIFEKGFTGYNGRHYKKATGQGLYLCKTILEKLSFNLEVLSEEGQGTKAILHFIEKREEKTSDFIGR